MITTKQVINMIAKKNRGKYLQILKELQQEKDDIPTKDFDKAKDQNKKEREKKWHTQKKKV